jgi:aryl-alcohol dehydrogenase-like predicted oxidoreductase
MASCTPRAEQGFFPIYASNMPAEPGAAQIGLGLAALGRPGYINLGHGHDVKDVAVERMERAAHEVLDAAYDAGVRAFDAARSYGRAEAFLASWLARRGLGPGDVEVSSKWGYTYTADWRVDADEHEVKELTAAQLRRQWRETEELLGGHVRLYQIHSATVDSGVLEDGEVRAELAALRDRGVRVGLTVTGVGQAVTIERALEVGGFDAVQATWNLHERSAAGVLSRAHEAGLYVMVKEAVANGRLTARGGNPALAAAARELGTTEDALALSAALARPWADLVLSGAATVDQLHSNMAARELVWDDALERRLAGLAEDPDGYWAARSRLPWN